jgi:hypothetical protein
MWEFHGVSIVIGVPQNRWFIVDNPIKMDDLEVPPFQETSISIVFMGVVKTNFGQVG